MEEYIITGIIYTEIDDTIGPNPILWIPSDLSEDIRMKVGVKSITLLTAEYGLIPKTLSIIPFPSLEMKGIIKFLEFADKTRRGGVTQSAITLLFNEVNDVIFYKAIEDLEAFFNESAENIIRIEELKANKEKIYQEIEQLHTNILNTIENLRIKETSQLKAFPEKVIKDTEIINYQFKVIVCGDPMVGKTSIIIRFTDNAFNRSYYSSIGINVSDKVLQINDINVQLIIWDIAGHSKFKIIRAPFYKGAKGVLLVFDLTNPKSFSSIKTWYDDIKKNTMDPLIGIILGNKDDIIENREISKKEALKLKKELNLEYIETSALTGDNIYNSFYKMAEKLYLKSKQS